MKPWGVVMLTAGCVHVTGFPIQGIRLFQIVLTFALDNPPGTDPHLLHDGAPFAVWIHLWRPLHR